MGRRAKGKEKGQNRKKDVANGKSMKCECTVFGTLDGSMTGKNMFVSFQVINKVPSVCESAAFARLY
jgi:hypothetical protein